MRHFFNNRTAKMSDIDVITFKYTLNIFSKNASIFIKSIEFFNCRISYHKNIHIILDQKKLKNNINCVYFYVNI
jgi:hypothetical protein